MKGTKRPGKLKTLINLFDLRYLNGWNSLRSSLGFTRSLLRPRQDADNLEQIFNLSCPDFLPGHLRPTHRKTVCPDCPGGFLPGDQSGPP